MGNHMLRVLQDVCFRDGSRMTFGAIDWSVDNDGILRIVDGTVNPDSTLCIPISAIKYYVYDKKCQNQNRSK